MRVEVMQFYGLTNPLTQAGYYETDTHKQLTKDIRAAILEGMADRPLRCGGLRKNRDAPAATANLTGRKPGYRRQIAVGGKKQH